MCLPAAMAAFSCSACSGLGEQMSMIAMSLRSMRRRQSAVASSNPPCSRAASAVSGDEVATPTSRTSRGGGS